MCDDTAVLHGGAGCGAILPEQVHLGRETPREPGENARIECELKGKRLVKAYDMIVDPSRPTQMNDEFYSSNYFHYDLDLLFSITVGLSH